MLLHRPHIHSASLRQAVYIVCLCFVFSYIAFDVLDLDGSNLYSFNLPQHFSLIAVIPSETEIPYSFGEGENVLRGNNLVSANDESPRPQVYSLILTLVSLARAHGYKVNLARNSLSEPSPYG